MNRQANLRDSAGVDFRDRRFLVEMLLTLAAALWTGLAGSLVLILLVFTMSGQG